MAELTEDGHVSCDTAHKETLGRQRLQGSWPGLWRWVADLRKHGLGRVQTRWGFETPLPPPNCMGTIRLCFNRLSAARPLRCQHVMASELRRVGPAPPATATPVVACSPPGRATLRGAALR